MGRTTNFRGTDMSDDTKPTPADDDAVEETTELDATPEPDAGTPTDSAADDPTLVTPVAATTADAPAPHAFDRRTAGFTAIGISALLIAFFGGYALGEHDDEDERGFRGAAMGMRGGQDGTAPQHRGGGMEGRQQGGPGGQGGVRGGGMRGEMRGEMRHGGRAGGTVGAVTKVDGDKVTVKPARGDDDEVTVDREEIVAVGGRHAQDDGDDAAKVEVGDIVVFRTDE